MKTLVYKIDVNNDILMKFKEVGLKIKPKFIYNYDTELVGVEYSYRAKTEQQVKQVYQIERMFDKFVAFDLI